MGTYLPPKGLQEYYQTMFSQYNNTIPPEQSMKIPLFPLLEHENDLMYERDMDYMRQHFPKEVKKIQHEIEDQCDRLEYDGSCMFDQYPDQCHLSILVDQIYQRVSGNSDTFSNQSLEAKQTKSYPLWSGYCPPNQPCKRRQEPDWLRNIIEVMLQNEIQQRRRRYRNRKRWF